MSGCRPAGCGRCRSNHRGTPSPMCSRGAAGSATPRRPAASKRSGSGLRAGGISWYQQYRGPCPRRYRMTTSGLARAVHVSLLGVSLATLAPPGAAQLIQIRTVPFAQGDQFSIFPSNNLGMGGVSITVPDTLLDPFTNPAKAARLAGGRFFSAPTVSGLPRHAGGGRTLPLGTIATAGPWYAGLALALQQIDASRTPSFSGPVPLARLNAPPTVVDVRPNPRSYG